jgi:hypothetical protein
MPSEPLNLSPPLPSGPPEWALGTPFESAFTWVLPEGLNVAEPSWEGPVDEIIGPRP